MSKSYIEIELAGGVARIEPITDNIVRIRAKSDGLFQEPTLLRYGVIRPRGGNVKYSVKKLGSTTRIQWGDCKLELSKAGTLSFYNKQGDVLLKSSRALEFKSGFSAEFDLSKSEKIYGLGDVTRERIEKRGFRTAMWVKNVRSYVPIPYVMSSGGWGLFLNTTWKHFFDIGHENKNKMKFWARGGELDFYLFAGESMADLLNHYTLITGRPTLLPQWAYGLTFVCNEQATAREMIDDALQMRREGIPCDVIGLEPGWMSQHYDYSTEKEWHSQRFYIPPWVRKPGDVSGGNNQTFMGAVKRLGYKVSLWLCCDYDLSFEEERLVKGSLDKSLLNQTIEKRSEDDFEQDVHFGHGPTKMDKLTKPEEPWFEHLKKFVSDGASAFKLDGALQVNEHPDRKWGNGMSDEEMHNLYPLILNKQMFRGFVEMTKRRPMVYSSGGYAGIQQYSATWAGDTGGGPKPLVSMVNHGMSGHVNTSCDMDVFSPAGIHFGFLQPWSQVCSWAYWRHPWLLGEKLLPIFKFYANLRYQLLPYIYSIAHQAHQTGYPILRGMPLEYPNDPASDRLIHQYMFGGAFLVTAFTSKVHLPEGTWHDYWTGMQYKGPLDLDCKIPDDRGGPLFVKSGSIIPQAPVVDFVGQKPLTKIILQIYPDRISEFTMTEDDGESFEYLNGKKCMTLIRCEHSVSKTCIKISARKGRYDGMSEKRTYEIVLHVLTKPQKVMLNKNEVTEGSWVFNAEKNELRLDCAEDLKRKRDVELVLSW